MKTLDRMITSDHFWTLKINQKHKTSWGEFIQGKPLKLGKSRGFLGLHVVMPLPPLLPSPSPCCPRPPQPAPLEPTEDPGVQSHTENSLRRLHPSCLRLGQSMVGTTDKPHPPKGGLWTDTGLDKPHAFLQSRKSVCIHPHKVHLSPLVQARPFCLCRSWERGCLHDQRDRPHGLKCLWWLRYFWGATRERGDVSNSGQSGVRLCAWV